MGILCALRVWRLRDRRLVSILEALEHGAPQFLGVILTRLRPSSQAKAQARFRQFRELSQTPAAQEGHFRHRWWPIGREGVQGRCSAAELPSKGCGWSAWLEPDDTLMIDFRGWSLDS
ncbi:unnamed protein product [Effrenium voratum]|nr:unnamed protein product [Effrenium voratum]